MTRDELNIRIRNNLENHGVDLVTAKILLQPDPFHGWRLAVVTQDFENRTLPERKSATLGGIEEHFEWLDLLTPSEKEWAGPLPGQEEPSELPLWPEALARGARADQTAPHFATDLDDELSPPVVVTFYSLRGGVGRSTALAQTGRILSEKGFKVVCVDMDLEAPGLANLLGVDEPDIGEHGVVSLLTALDQRREVRFSEHLFPAPNSDSLYLVPAGVPNAEYARRLRQISPEMWYREDYNPLKEMMNGLKTGLSFTPDVILLDARTGISEISAPLLFDLADLAIVVFFPHPQAKTGTEILTRGLLSTQVKGRPDGVSVSPAIRFLISPIPAIQIPEAVKRYRHRPLEWISDWVDDFNEIRERSGDEPLFPNEISHFVHYNEGIATSDVVEYDGSPQSPYGQLVDWIIQFMPDVDSAVSPHPLQDVKSNILATLSFSTGLAESQPKLLDQFIQTESVKRALSKEVALIIGRKGTGKTALFRKISEGERNAIVLHAPTGLEVRKRQDWMMNADGFLEVEKILEGVPDSHWRHFWFYYAIVAVGTRLEEQARNWIQQTFQIASQPQGVSGFLDAFAALLKQPRPGIRLIDALLSLDPLLESPHILTLDGLDTGFGSSEAERARRKRAIDGLFSFWAETASRLSNISFKIFLREDIWRQVELQNKSHLFGKDVNLKWKDTAAFLKVALRQALEAESLQTYLGQNDETAHLVRRGINNWSPQEVHVVWNLLVGERMKGGNTAFSRNWVWSRLADANLDHSPRALLQLLHHALNWEREESSRNPYPRSIIRPRAMISCLNKVSEEALQAIEEEFEELKTVIQTFKSIQRSPFARSELTDDTLPIDLAKEVGLLGVHEEDADGVIRYKVPDFYRLALGMTRKGPA